jgi:enoyl-CoA hydratase/carnithine racemase
LGFRLACSERTLEHVGSRYVTWSEHATDRGALAKVTLVNPERRNALSLDVLLELTDVLRRVAASDALCTVLSAEGPVFSAGHDFSDMRGASLDDVRQLFAVCAELMQTIQQVPQIVIAKVHALATAAGCQLVASCDMAIAAESASFALPGGKGGLFCHTPLVAVARQISRKRALEMAVTGDAISAATAAEWGLINRAVPDDQLDAAVDDLVARSMRGSPAGKALGKATFYAQIELDQASAYEYASEVMAQGAVSGDGQEGINSFLEKRRANFMPPSRSGAAVR